MQQILFFRELEFSLKERWSEKYAESQKKMAKYTKDDYNKIKNDPQESLKKVAALMDKGSDHPDVQALMNDNFNYIDKTFYSCSPEMFKGLGQMYIDDERFTIFYEKEKTGLVEFMRDAMKIYADNLLEKSAK